MTLGQVTIYNPDIAATNNAAYVIEKSPSYLRDSPIIHACCVLVIMWLTCQEKR